MCGFDVEQFVISVLLIIKIEYKINSTKYPIFSCAFSPGIKTGVLRGCADPPIKFPLWNADRILALTSQK